MTFPAWWPSATPAPTASTPASLWQELKAKIDLAQARPAQAEGVLTHELSDRTGPYVVLKNPRTRTYQRLSPGEHWLWQRMDGTRTVQDLVVAYFLQYHSFAFGLIAGLVAQLGFKQMLREKPQFVFSAVGRAVAEATTAHKLSSPALVLLTRQWVIRGLDGWMTRLHRAGGWVFYTLPAQIIYLLVSAVGLYLFTRILGDARFKFGGGGLGQSAALLWVAAILPIVIHELAHALTTKHFGCEVHQGGLMLYFGMPAAFVDTTDIWTQGKRARLAVTWAGPYTGLIIGGLCSITIWLWPGLGLAPLLFQVAAVGMITTVMNLNPLLKLDGYYLLSDALEIAQLRERSLAFLRHKLVPKVLKRERNWTRDEIIFVVFGVLSGLWTVYIIYVSLIVWNRRVAQSVQAILSQPGDIGALLVNLLLILLALSFLTLIGFQLVRLVRLAVAWAVRRKLLGTPGRAGLAVTIGAATLALLPQIVAPDAAPIIVAALGLLAFAWGVRLALALAAEMRGSMHAKAWPAIAASLTLLGLAQIMPALRAPVAGPALWLDVAGAVAGLMALIFSGRLVAGLRGGWRAVSALTLALGGAALVAQRVAGGQAAAHAFAGLLILGGLLHWRYAIVTSGTLEPLIAQPATTRDRLMTAFDLLARSALAELRSTYGRGTARRVETAFNRASAAQHWTLAFVEGQLRAQSVPARPAFTAMTAADLAEVYAAALTSLLDAAAMVAGDSFARRALARGYDALDWEGREIAGEYILARMRWAAGLAEMFRETRHDVTSLLERAPLFVSFTPEEIQAVARRLRSETFAAGADIVRQGGKGDRFYLLRRGRVKVLVRNDEGDERAVNELVSGDYFGEAALLTGEPRNATVCALTPVEALSLSKRDFDRLVRAGFEGGAKIDAVLKRIGLLRRIPLFADFESYELKLVAAQLETQEAEAGATIIRQGEVGDKFYIVEAGEAAVRLRGPDGAEVERARLGPGDYFGEIALLMDVPRVASVVAVGAARLLTLNAAAFNELVRESRSAKLALERAGSRRALSNEQFMKEAQ
ncbi:MAG: cyclic nucleotide-binding domain-containing protein [Chloroflexi bacterium]|nr:cyclic nucleotide-binding domain-containing protein [Chloroflexota bacterium]